MVYPRSDGECVTVLSIDGEVQGIVPAVLLNFLEDQLKVNNLTFQSTCLQENN